MEECINAKKNRAGSAPLNFSKISKIIKKSTSDLFIPIFHFGYEYEKLPQPLHVLKCRKLLKNDKVKIIIGHHPHVVGAFDSNIYYSLGNFYFGKMRTNFYNLKNYSKESSTGIGVIFDTETFDNSIISFIFDGKETRIVEESELINISNISDKEYKNYFYENNNFLNRNSVYKTGIINEIVINKLKYYRRSLHKSFLRYVKWPLIRNIKHIIGGNNES